MQIASGGNRERSRINIKSQNHHIVQFSPLVCRYDWREVTLDQTIRSTSTPANVIILPVYYVTTIPTYLRRHDV